MEIPAAAAIGVQAIGNTIATMNVNQSLNLSVEASRQIEAALKEVLWRRSASDGGKTNTSPTDTAAFVVRREYFGCLLFDRRNSDYIPFDQDAAKIFQLALTETPDKVFSYVQSKFDRESLDTFYKLCQSINLMDGWGRFNGTFLDNVATESELSAPTMVHLAVTNACNFRCGHCFASSAQPYADELTTGEIKGLIDDIAGMGCFKLQLGGGEPLVRRDLPELVGYANRRGIKVSLSTNAVAATKEAVESLTGLTFEEILVSLDGANAEVYEAIRGETGSFQQALTGIANLKLLESPIALRHLLVKANAAESEALVELADSLGIKRVIVRTALPLGRAAEQRDILLNPSEVNSAWERFRNVIHERVVVETWGRIPPPDRKRFFNGFGCECGRLHCYIDARGTVWGSGLLKTMPPSGNLRQQRLQQIWQSGFDSLRGMPGNLYCRHCSYFRSCRGGCRASALVNGHDLNAPDANCLIAADAGWRPAEKESAISASPIIQT